MVSKNIHLIIIYFIALFSFFLVQTAAKENSLTWDEPTYIVSGYSYIDNREIKLNPEAPPFLQALIALPLQFLKLQPPDYEHPYYIADRQVAFAYMFLDKNKESFDKISFWSRFPIWILFALLVISAGLFVNKVAVAVSGIMASVLITTSPNLIAHAQLATTDLGCAVFMFISILTLYLAVHTDNFKYWIFCGFATGIALLTKYTALLLAPIFLLIILYEIIFNKPCKNILIRGLMYCLFTILLILCAGYGFKPWLFLDGISQIYTRALEYQTYLFGKIFENTVWYYYLAAFLVKTPVPTLLLLIFAIYITIRYHVDRNIIVYLLVPVGVVIFVSSFDMTNIGLRRILPIYPFLFAYISFTYFYLEHDKSKKILFRILIVWNIVTVIITYPNYISFFNIVVGGAGNGPNLLEDSNIDWGQDLPALVEWQKNNLPDEPINLKYFGSINPELYGLKFRRIDEVELINPQKGIYAISVHYLIYTRKLAYWNKKNLDWLERFKPIGYAGNSIYIYRFL